MPPPSSGKTITDLVFSGGAASSHQDISCYRDVWVGTTCFSPLFSVCPSVWCFWGLCVESIGKIYSLVAVAFTQNEDWSLAWSKNRIIRGFSGRFFISGYFRSIPRDAVLLECAMAVQTWTLWHFRVYCRVDRKTNHQSGAIYCTFFVELFFPFYFLVLLLFR